MERREIEITKNLIEDLHYGQIPVTPVHWILHRTSLVCHDQISFSFSFRRGVLAEEVEGMRWRNLYYCFCFVHVVAIICHMVQVLFMKKWQVIEMLISSVSRYSNAIVRWICCSLYFSSILSPNLCILFTKNLPHWISFFMFSFDENKHDYILYRIQKRMRRIIFKTNFHRIIHWNSDNKNNFKPIKHLHISLP